MKAGRAARIASFALLAMALGCESSRGVGSNDTPQPPPSPSAKAAEAKPSAARAANAPPADTAISATSVAADETGSLLVEGIVQGEPQIGRPGPGVLIVANDPRYQLPLQVLRVEPEGAADFPVGEQVVLGIHSPSRTFPGGVGKGQKVQLRIHWRKPDGGPRRYFHIKRDRGWDDK
ncbi:MAG: hypothetical protein JRI23_11135 [Deltaproteobacteria bacterium]|nr:hypothetical protein [Deltaproteobacteria bacterium]MBW2532236.1 hypothetical protein [Deltaproteobacteria bacterium]